MIFGVSTEKRQIHAAEDVSQLPDEVLPVFDTALEAAEFLVWSERRKEPFVLLRDMRDYLHQQHHMGSGRRKAIRENLMRRAAQVLEEPPHAD